MNYLPMQKWEKMEWRRSEEAICPVIVPKAVVASLTSWEMKSAEMPASMPSIALRNADAPLVSAS